MVANQIESQRIVLFPSNFLESDTNKKRNESESIALATAEEPNDSS